jgi:hypothetical protein
MVLSSSVGKYSALVGGMLYFRILVRINLLLSTAITREDKEL